MQAFISFFRLSLFASYAVLFIFSLAFSQNSTGAHKSIISLHSLATGKFIVTWDNGNSADLHASANTDDTRAELEIVNAENGFIGLRSRLVDKFWSLDTSSANTRVVCTSSDLSDNALFSLVQNPDGSISLKSRVNGKFISVVSEDTVIIPSYDSATIANHSIEKTATGENTTSLVVTPSMLKPYIVTFSVLHAISPDIGDREKFNISVPALKKTAATERLSKVLTYMYGICGSKTISGIHNREPNSDPAHWTNWVYGQCGKYPALWSGDFLFESENIATRGTMINEAKNQWNNGAAVVLMYHMCPPTQGEACAWSGGVQSSLSSDQWNLLIQNGTTLNTTFKQRLKTVGTYMKTLKDAGVEVLFRPFHEMNQSAFWWGGRTGTSGTSKLFQIAHDYLVDTMGLTNVFFIWSIQDLSWNFSDYNPGENYWDLMTMDFYNGDGFTSKKYNSMLDVAGNRLIGIAETGTVPTSAELKAQPRWVYFSGWSELTNGDIKGSYGGSTNTLSRDEMPGWNNVVAKSVQNVGIDTPDPSLSAAQPILCSVTARSVIFRLNRESFVTISIHNALGQKLMTVANGVYNAGNHVQSFSSKTFLPGIYFVRLSTPINESTQKISILK